MASFGRYQTVRELHRGGFTVLYSGRTAENPEAKYVIKVFQPSTFLLETEQVKVESDLFLNSAQVQQKTAVSGAQYWAPIHKFGSIPDGAFFATDKYDRSLQQLIDSNIALSTQALHKIIESVTKGLIELKKACGRPHGNLKATNILIAGKGDMSQTTIVLSDPLPNEHIDTAVHWDSDLRDIAEFIYQLVIHRPSPNVDGWQAQDTKEWAKLGKQAQEWRSLCNRLLVSHMKPGTITLEILIEELARLKKIKPVLSTPRLLIAAGFLVIAVAAIICIKSTMSSGKAAEMEDWNHLLTEYFGWVDKLRTELGGPTENDREKRWRGSPDLSIIVENIKGKEKASLPYYVSRRAGLLERDLKNKTIEQLQNENRVRIYDKETKNALKAIEVVKCFFDLKSEPNSFRFFNDPNLPMDKQEYRKWPVLVQIQQVSKKFGSRGWQGHEKYLLNMVDDIKPDPNIAEHVDKILELQPSLGDIKSCWTEIENNEKIIANSGDPFVTRFSNYIKQEPAIVLDINTRADVNNVSKKLLDELQNRKQLSRKLARSINDNWQKLKDNQEIIKNTGNPTLAKFPDYIQSKLASVDLDALAEKLKEIRISSDKLAGFITDKWQHLNENQNKIIDTGDPVLAKFPDYINSKLDSADIDILSGKTDLDILRLKLEEINSLTDTLATFEWQKVVKELFNNDLNYSELKYRADTLVSKDTFDDWLVLAKKYQRIEDPREGKDVKKQWNITVENAGNSIRFLEAEPTTKSIAGNLKTQLKEIEDKFDNMPENLENEGIFLIVRDEKLVQQKLNSWKENLRDIANKADLEVSKLVPPAEWLDKVLQWKIIGSQAIHNAWLKRRKNILDDDTTNKLKKDDRLTLVGVRPKTEKVWESLNKLNNLAKRLDRNFAEALPLLESISINNIDLQNGYYEERENVFQRIIGKFPADEVPDINDPESFKPEWHQELDTFRRYDADLATLVNSFYEVHKKLKACYLLDDELTVKNVSEFDKLYSKLRRAKVFTGIFAEKSSINRTFQNLTGRIARLEEIEESNDRQKLAGMALEDKSHPEAVYATWLKLGELLDPQWPAEPDDLKNERKIRNKLKIKFGEIEEFNRKQELLTILDKIASEREIVFKKANIKRYKTTITTNAFQDRILIAFETFQPTEDNINDITALEVLAEQLKDFVTDPNWPKEFRTDLFKDESPIYDKTSLAKNDFYDWIIKIKEYQIFQPDPRENPKYDWDQRINKIEGLIDKELARKQADESFGKLETLKSKFNAIRLTIKNIQSLPAINMYKDRIDKSGDYWEQLLEIERSLKPDYCNRIELENKQLIFASNNLHPKFEPIFDVENKMPVTLKTGWEDIRKAVNEKQKGWLDFFYTIDMNDTKNAGWPRYIRSTMDPSVILRFIPAGSGNPEPFYMAAQEVSNAQYRLYMEKISAVKPSGIGVLNLFKDQSNNELISSSKYEDPARSCKITWNGKSFNVTQGSNDIPVTWVTYSGARSYARWLNGQLPTASQHKYACEAQDSIPPWANNQEIPVYAHVRGGDWKTAADEYNTFINSDELKKLVAKKVPAPVGAIPEDFVSQTPLDSTQTAHEEKKYGSPWPVDHAESTNAWDLYDMIGNVWEWCQDGTLYVICGGSCLAPPKYVTNPSNYSVEFSKKTACDVGFRIVVPAR